MKKGPVNRHAFYIAVTLVTLLGVMSALGFLYLSTLPFLALAFHGFLGTMFLNVFFPHLGATLYTRSYCPGTATGLFLMAPVTLGGLLHGVRSGVVTLPEIALSTSVTAVCLTFLIALCFWAYRFFEKFRGGL